jgi:hypothetical protein
MPLAPSAGRVFFPLDEELALLSGALTPSLHETVVRLGIRMPFESVVQELAQLKHVTTTAATVRRHTEIAGATYVALQTAEVERLEHTPPAVPEGAARQLLSADGAMVPVVHGEWVEVKTVALGEIQPPRLENGEAVVHTTGLSYFSRLAEAEVFSRLATVETHRRGTERAAVVCAVSDGAEWIQGFIDLQRHDAVRILDFSHAASYVTQVGEAVFGEGTPELTTWLATTLHTLKHASAVTVVQTLRTLQHELEGGSASGERLEQVRTAIQYLDKRVAQMEYARFQAAGYPIGSGSVESAHKVVIEARLKGAGMHWARRWVNPMAALRDALCSERWQEDWPQIASRLRTEHLNKRQARQRVRWTQRHTPPPIPSRAAPGWPAQVALPSSDLSRAAKAKPMPSCQEKPKRSYRPPANHPWRHSPIGRARFESSQRSGSPKV